MLVKVPPDHTSIHRHSHRASPTPSSKPGSANSEYAQPSTTHRIDKKDDRTFGKLTFGTMTLWRALGASLGGFLGSPPGWYCCRNQNVSHWCYKIIGATKSAKSRGVARKGAVQRPQRTSRCVNGIQGLLTYLKCSRASSPLVLSVCHGMLPAATLTFASDVADVGLRPVGRSIELTVVDARDQTYRSRNLRDQKLQT